MDPVTVHRAAISKGISNEAGYRAIERILAPLPLLGSGLVVDVGCGQGNLGSILRPYFGRYLGVDVLRHTDFPSDQELILHDLDQPGIPIADGSVEVAIACEVTPQLENPRILFRELARLVKPGGWVVVTNPNLLSLLSLTTLLTRRRFNAFQDEAYPLMLTPVLESDLIRMAREVGLVEIRTFYTHYGRIAFTGSYYPRWLAERFPRACSDNLGIIGQKPE